MKEQNSSVIVSILSFLVANSYDENTKVQMTDGQN